MNYQEKVQALRQRHEALLQRKNQVMEGGWSGNTTSTSRITPS